MESTLIGLVIILVIVLTAILILFHRQGLRLKEEMTMVQKNEGIKSAYLSDVSMSFREPLKNIIKECDSLIENEHIAAHQEILDTITGIRNKSRQLIQFSNEILEMSNMESNIPHSTKIEVNLIELIMSYRREILYDVDDNVPVNIRTEMSPHTKVWIDTTMIRQLIMHLLRSAAQNTHKGHITIRYAAEREGLRFWIENTHEEIPKEILDTMFTKQIDPRNNEISDDKDTVLSMSICKTIIDGMNGKIEATSRKTEQGNLLVVSFWFPCPIKIAQ